MKRPTALALAVVVMASGCDSVFAETEGGSEDEAAGIATAFLESLRAMDTDTAWSLVYPPNRSAFFADDRDRFEVLVERIDLARVRWQVIEVRPHDGRYRVELALDPLQVDEALGTFIQIGELDGAPVHASILVRIEPFNGSRGVYGG